MSKIFVYHYIKIHCSDLLEWIFLTCDFVASCICHLENMDSLSYVDLPNADKFDYKIKKLFILISIISNLKRVL